MNFILDLDPVCSVTVSMISFAFPEDKILLPLLFDKMIVWKNDFIITKPIFYRSKETFSVQCKDVRW